MSFLVDFDGVSHVLKSIQYGKYIKSRSGQHLKQKTTDYILSSVSSKCNCWDS